MSESYDVGTRAWQPDPTEGWVASEVVKKTVDGSKVVLQFKLENGEVRRSSPCRSLVAGPDTAPSCLVICTAFYPHS